MTLSEVKPSNRILECAIEAQGDYVVSGERDLPALKLHAGSTMLSLTDFLATLRKVD
jgi:hypothetical protein